MQGVPSPQDLPTQGPSLTPPGCNPQLCPGSPCVTPGPAVSLDPRLLGLPAGNKHPLLWGSVGPSNPIESATPPSFLHSKRQQWTVTHVTCLVHGALHLCGQRPVLRGTQSSAGLAQASPGRGPGDSAGPTWGGGGSKRTPASSQHLAASAAVCSRRPLLASVHGGHSDKGAHGRTLGWVGETRVPPLLWAG